MSDANSQLLNFVCPKCQKKLRAPSNLAGQKLVCPKCTAPIRVPGIVETKNDDDDWLSLNEPAKPKAQRPDEKKSSAKGSLEKQPLIAKKPPLPTQIEPDELLLAPLETRDTASLPTTSTPIETPLKTTAAKSVFDDDLPDLAPIEELKSEPRGATSPPAKKSISKPALALPDVSLPELSLESPALIGPLASLDDEAFSFSCKVCGSLLSSSRSRVGTSINCPDCYSKLLVPGISKKKKQAEIKMDAEVASVTFAPIDSFSVRDPRGSSEKTKEFLNRAEQTMEEERAEFLDGTFDTKRWMGLLFGFLRDPLVIAAAVGAGFVSGFWLFAIAAMGTWIPLEGAQVLIAKLALLCIFCIPIFGFICLCGIAILTMSANRATRVQEWPFAKLFESIGECSIVVVSILAASIPGGILGVVSSSLNAHPMVSLAFILIGIWGLTPILMLSMIQNSSMFEPYSKAIWLSINSRAEAWGAMYMQTGIAFTLFFMFMLVASSQSPLGDFFVGLMLPVSCFFLFSQYGVLAGRVSDVTEMGFEGDFSAD